MRGREGEREGRGKERGGKEGRGREGKGKGRGKGREGEGKNPPLLFGQIEPCLRVCFYEDIAI